jgi:hypothetical protein
VQPLNLVLDTRHRFVLFSASPTWARLLDSVTSFARTSLLGLGLFSRFFSVSRQIAKRSSADIRRSDLWQTRKLKKTQGGVPARPVEVAGPIAKCVVYGAILYIVVMSLFGMLATVFVTQNQENITQIWKDALTFTLPVLGAWVGTVLAFFFSKENFEAANRSVRDMVSQVGVRERLRGVSAKAVMIPRGSIIDIKLAAGKSEATVSLVNDVIPKFNDKVTRVPVFLGNDAARCVIHESMAYKFLYQAKTKDPNADPTLKDVLDDPIAGKLITGMAFVAETASLADAQDP